MWWDKHSCCRGLYKCKEAVSVSSVAQLMRANLKNPLQCTKRGNKNRAGAGNEACKGSVPSHSPSPVLQLYYLNVGLMFTQGFVDLSMNVLNITFCFNADGHLLIFILSSSLRSPGTVTGSVRCCELGRL